jgi:hypothetical protein
MPAWVEVSIEKGEGVFKKVPDRDEFAADVNESLRRAIFPLISFLRYGAPYCQGCFVSLIGVTN